MKTMDYEDFGNVSLLNKTLLPNTLNTPSTEDIVTIDAEVDLRLHRELPASKILNAATEFVEEKIMRFLAYEFEQFSIPKHSFMEERLPEVSTESKDTAFEELRKIHLKKFTDGAQAKARAYRKNKFLFSIEPGLEIIVPPYDAEGAHGFESFSSANKVSGSFRSFPIGNGYGASGLGVFLSATENMTVQYSAHCPISFSWSNFINEGGGYAASRGGIGITVYNASTGMLIDDEQEVLWSQSKRLSCLEMSGGSEDLLLQNTAIGNIHFKMNAGQVYLVWLWCWAFSDAGHNAAAFANMDCKVPFMIIDASTDEK